MIFFLWLMNIFLRTRWMTKLQFFWIIFLIKFENGKSNSGLHSLIQDRTGWGSDLLSMPPSILAILLNRYRITWIWYSSIFFNMHRVTWIGYSSIFLDMHRVTWTLLRNTLLPGCSAILKKQAFSTFTKRYFWLFWKYWMKLFNLVAYPSWTERSCGRIEVPFSPKCTYIQT